MESKREPVRVLHVLTGLSTGGAESFIMNMYRNMDREKVQFDFLLRSDENVYRDELEQMGSRVYTTASFPRNFIKNAFQTERFFREHRYDIIHVHANALLYTFALSSAKRNGVSCRIIHSHNAAMAHMELLPIHTFNKKRIGKLATDFFACSEDAGKWMFPGDFSVIHNAIDLNTYAYSPEKRTQVRTQLGIPKDAFVIGHIGRFVKQKNHAFLIETFHEVLQSKPEARLLLVGDGELRPEMEEKVEKLRIADRVIFLGTRKDAADIINAFDLFVFPSLYEGLSIAALEAQANGLTIICSGAIPNQILFGNNAKKILLSEGPGTWAKHILCADSTRRDMKMELSEMGFDIQEEAKKMQDFYTSKACRNYGEM